MIQIRQFKDMSVDELYDCLKLRSDVFIIEQQCIYADIDGIDKVSYHVWLDEMKAYLRLFYKDDHTIQMGRVVSRERGKGYGQAVVEAAIRFIRTLPDVSTIFIEAQCYAVGFYERFGFTVVSEPFDEDGIPHVRMILALGEAQHD